MSPSVPSSVSRYAPQSVPGVVLFLCCLLLLPLRAQALESLAIQEQLRERITAHRQIVAYDAGSADSLRILAQSHERLAEWSRALAYYRRLLQLDPDNALARRGCERLEKLVNVRAELSWLHSEGEDYWAAGAMDDYTRSEERWQMEVRKPFAATSAFSLGGEYGRVWQESEIFGGSDFSLDYRGAFARWSLPLSTRFSVLGRVSYSSYQDSHGNGYYPLGEETGLLSGNLNFTLQPDLPTTLTLVLARYRDIAPLYDADTGRTWLDLRAGNLAGFIATRALTDSWQARGGIFYTDATADDPEQTRLQGALSWYPQSLAGLQTTLQGDYYSADAETVISLHSLYRWTVAGTLSPLLEYRIAYSDFEESWQNLARVGVEWRYRPKLIVRGEASSGFEFGEDKDRYTQFTAAVETRF